MTSIELSLFDFIDEAIREAGGVFDGDAKVESGSTILIFCESFFDQFFGSLGRNITGFGARSKRDAARFAETLSKKRDEVSLAVRKIIVDYEEFCELAKDIEGDYSDSPITYERVNDFVLGLLMHTRVWAQASHQVELAKRVEQALTDYEAAM